MVKISGILSINNAVYLGYPFIEAVLSVLPIVDEFLINDGGSDDETPIYLKKLQKTFPNKIRLFNKSFYPSNFWEAVDNSLNFLINKAKGNWLFEVQGDEVWHEKDILKVKETIEKASIEGYNSIRAVLQWINFQAIDPYKYRNVRMVRRIKDLKSHWCGDDFRTANTEKEGPTKGFTGSNIPPELVTNLVYFNLGLDIVFPGNTIERARAHVTFLARAQEERRTMLKILESLPLQRQEPNPEVVKKLPALIQGLAGFSKYKVRDELFDKKFLKKLTGITYK